MKQKHRELSLSFFYFSLLLSLSLCLPRSLLLQWTAGTRRLSQIGTLVTCRNRPTNFPRSPCDPQNAMRAIWKAPAAIFSFFLRQVLLPFNLLARLLPPNPTEEDGQSSSIGRKRFDAQHRVGRELMMKTQTPERVDQPLTCDEGHFLERNDDSKHSGLCAAVCCFSLCRSSNFRRIYLLRANRAGSEAPPKVHAARPAPRVRLGQLWFAASMAFPTRIL